MLGVIGFTPLTFLVKKLSYPGTVNLSTDQSGKLSLPTTAAPLTAAGTFPALQMQMHKRAEMLVTSLTYRVHKESYLSSGFGQNPSVDQTQVHPYSP